ncbi:glycosyltransferase family 4 protein [Pedobacter sp. R20-19]|uniref:glycosyltransferase family 4 protein n=1 Tax=Pedobacter sp. R20-19 TaxID=1270196 RepID=UPI000493AFF2|nr:glycosyltransferase family 4 protein [Pedobacter sp. R20-19]
MKSLAIIVTHPIQYYVPVYQQLAKACRLRVFYTWGEKGAASKYDPDFNKHIQWDIPLLEGYPFEFQENTAKDPGSHHYKGIVNPKLIENIKAFQPDAILIYGWAYQSHLAAMRYFKGKIPIWFRGDSNLLDETSRVRKILRKLFLIWVYQHIDLAFYVASANKAYYKAFGLNETKLVFAPHAVDNERFSTAPKQASENIREHLNIKNDEVLILFAGKLESKKNPLLLLKAFAEITLANTHLLFVGNGELEVQLKASAQLHHKKDKLQKVHFMDFQNQSQMPAVYQACDLFCLPSQGPGETWGLAINEAMAAGKAILASDKVGSATDLILKNKNGDTFTSGDLTDLKNKLQFLCKHRESLLAMGLVSKEIIENWTFEQQVNVLIKTLND